MADWERRPEDAGKAVSGVATVRAGVRTRGFGCQTARRGMIEGKVNELLQKCFAELGAVVRLAERAE